MRLPTRSASFARLRAFMLGLTLLVGLVSARPALAASGTVDAWGRYDQGRLGAPHSYGGPIVLNGPGAHTTSLFSAAVAGGMEAARTLSIGLAGTYRVPTADVLDAFNRCLLTFMMSSW